MNQRVIFEEKRVKVNDIYINFATAGKGKAIILIHGWNNNWMGFIPLGNYLAKRFKVYLVDLPGFGDSDTLPCYTLESEANYLNLFVDKLKIQKPIIAGHSMGAYVVCMFHHLFPQKAERIVLIAPMFKKKNKEKLMKVTEYFYRMVRRTLVGQRLVKKIVDTNIYSYLTAKFINMYKFDWNLVVKTGVDGKKKVSARAYVDMGIEIARTYSDCLIENNKVPISLVFGKHDKLTNAKQAKYILEGRGKYNIVEVDKAGHILTVEQPEMTAKAITNSLN